MVKLIAGLLILAALGLLVYSVLQDRDRSGRSRGVSGRIDGKLLKATKGDRALAERLLQGARLKYPGKPDRWYVDKVLYDLQRDGAGPVR
ncbi:hypothetical protein ACN4EG_15320 [Alkalinema pantanalense CENA528]|uniref:hypothetical protein n=1 Tax=Alkalinema pantanalense TaxID=1620705 RepID=UPI003D6FC16C